MPKITFVEHDGTHHAIVAEIGISVMRNAVDNNIPGIDADCGGQCACATCHVFVDEKWIVKVGVRGEDEGRLLDFVEGSQSNSRLSCQINVTPELDGLLVHLPESQH